MGRVAAPQPGAGVDGDEAVHVARPLRSQRRYSPARQASHSRHDRNTSTATRCPSTRPSAQPPRADLLDHADGLVTGDESVPRMELAAVLLVVGAAQPAGLDPEQRVVVADLSGEAALALEGSRCCEHHGSGVHVVPDFGVQCVTELCLFYVS